MAPLGRRDGPGGGGGHRASLPLVRGCGRRQRQYLAVVSQIVVRPNGPLEGTIQVGGAKNSALKLMAASLLAEGDYHLRNVPAITDVGHHGRAPDLHGGDGQPARRPTR